MPDGQYAPIYHGYTRDIFDTALRGNLIAVKFYVTEDRESVNQKDKKYLNHTPLHNACITCQLHVIHYLISNNAEIDAVDDYGYTPLLKASCHGNGVVVKILLDKGANINHQSVDNRTALHLAIIYNQMKIVKILVEKGADQTLRDNMNLSAIDLAAHFDKLNRRQICLENFK